MQPIKNIIFDLGGVILNIDFKKTEAAFRELGWNSFSDYISQHHITELFERYEIGKIDDLQFIEGISALMDAPVAAGEIVKAWNALLLDFPPERIALLKRAKKQYRTFLLSNTNALHLEEYQQRLYNTEGVRLEDLFERTYYSHVMQLRKPSAAIFEQVLKENKLQPGETLFIDDTASNFEEARELGLQILHLQPGTALTDLEIFRE